MNVLMVLGDFLQHQVAFNYTTVINQENIITERQELLDGSVNESVMIINRNDYADVKAHEKLTLPLEWSPLSELYLKSIMFLCGL